MRRIWQMVIVAGLGLGLAGALVGCGGSASTNRDKMSGDKMGADKMKADKMKGDKK
jgi:hypothetical protein